MKNVDYERSSGRWMRVDRDYIILDCGPHTVATMAENIGNCLWDTFPESEPIFRKHYDRAFKDGCATAIVSYAGSVAQVNAIREDDDVLFVASEVVTVEGLADVCAAMKGSGVTRQALLDCFHCGVGGGCEQLPEDPELWPTCHACGERLSVTELVCVNYAEIHSAVQRIHERFGDAGLVELMWATVSEMSAANMQLGVTV